MFRADGVTYLGPIGLDALEHEHSFDVAVRAGESGLGEVAASNGCVGALTMANPVRLHVPEAIVLLLAFVAPDLGDVREGVVLTLRQPDRLAVGAHRGDEGRPLRAESADHFRHATPIRAVRPQFRRPAGTAYLEE